jgi:hypothetical protein
MFRKYRPAVFTKRLTAFPPFFLFCRIEHKHPVVKHRVYVNRHSLKIINFIIKRITVFMVYRKSFGDSAVNALPNSNMQKNSFARPRRALEIFFPAFMFSLRIPVVSDSVKHDTLSFTFAVIVLAASHIFNLQAVHSNIGAPFSNVPAFFHPPDHIL